MEDQLRMPQQGLLSETATIQPFNPEMELLYSLNGGDSFFSTYGELNLGDLHNPDLLHTPTSFHWKVPNGNFPEALSVMVQVRKTEQQLYTEPAVFSYFTTQHDLPVILITTSEAGLVSEDSGILVFGKSSYEDSGFYKNWWSRSANFQQRGTAWERAAVVQYFDEGNLKYEQKCGMKISGNATRGFPQKSLQLVARVMYGKDRFEYPFFGDQGSKKYQSLVLRNSGNDNTKTMFSDLLMHRLAAESNLLTLAGQPAVVYLNGNYWGVYNIRERVDPYLIAKREGVSEDEVTILEGFEGSLKEGEEEIKRGFDQLLEKVRSGENEPEVYQEVGALIDLESFADYIVYETYFANSDWPGNNSMWYKAGDSKWKWILNDLDYGLAYLGKEQVKADLFEKLRSSPSVTGSLFNFLITQEQFKLLFEHRAEKILQTTLSPERIEQIYTETKSLYNAEIGRHVDRWRMIDSVEAWEENCSNNLSFLLNRPSFYRHQLKAL